MQTRCAMTAIAMLAGQVLAQSSGDALTTAAREATERLRAEQQRYEAGAATEVDLLERRRESIRTSRALAMRDAPHRVSQLFEEETDAATQQLSAVQRQFTLGAADDRAIATRRRDVLALRRAWAEWKQAMATREAQLLLKEEISVAEMQVAWEERRMALGAATAEEVSQRRAELSALRQRALP